MGRERERERRMVKIERRMGGERERETGGERERDGREREGWSK